MKICFNEATTKKYSTLEKDLEFCEKHGYDLIEISLVKLRDFLKDHRIEELADFFQHSHIKPFAFNALEWITFRDKQGQEEITNNFYFLCEMGEILNCRKIVVVPSFDIGGITKKEIKAETVKKLHELADAAEKYRVKLAFEFVGYPNCSVNTFGQAYDIVETVNRESVGIVLDCFHFHAMGSRPEDLQKADPNKIFILHLDDAEDLPVGALRDDKRLWPGDGAVDIRSILMTLKNIGYQDMVSIELFRPEYWEWEIEKTIRVAKEKTIAAVKDYFKLD